MDFRSPDSKTFRIAPVSADEGKSYGLLSEPVDVERDQGHRMGSCATARYPDPARTSEKNISGNFFPPYVEFLIAFSKIRKDQTGRSYLSNLAAPLT